MVLSGIVQYHIVMVNFDRKDPSLVIRSVYNVPILINEVGVGCVDFRNLYTQTKCIDCLHSLAFK